MARGDFPSAKQDQFVLRFPNGMRDRIKAAAEESNRSVNAEIIDRLQLSFDPLVVNVRNTGDLYGELDKIVERTLRTVREEERKAAVIPTDDKLNPEVAEALAMFMMKEGRSRAEAVNGILREWLTGQGYLKPDVKG
jgi:hypothetical protein